MEYHEGLFLRLKPRIHFLSSPNGISINIECTNLIPSIFYIERIIGITVLLFIRMRGIFLEWPVRSGCLHAAY